MITKSNSRIGSILMSAHTALSSDSKSTFIPRISSSPKAFSVVAIGLALLLSGCVTQSPPSQLGKLSVKAPIAFQSGHERTSFWNDSWMQDIQDPLLPKIIEEALEYNYNLVAAEGRLDAARATAVIQGSGKYPNLSIGTNGNRSQRNSAGGLVITSNRSKTFSLNVGTNWELDLWGRVRDQASAGLADYQASVEDYRDARFSIAANVARVWFRAISSELQLDIAIESLETFESNLEIIEENFKRGIVSALDLHLIRANVANSKSGYGARLRGRERDKRALEILLGRYPASEISIAKGFPQIKTSIPVGLPDELLNRRPDVRAAERRLAASSVGIKIAKKALLPGVSLNGSYGTSAREYDLLLDERFKIWNYGYNISLPVFQGGRINATKNRAFATYKQSLANYAQTVLIAFEEVETALFDEDLLLQDEGALRVAVDEYKAAVDVAWGQYSRGLVDIITVLDSQRRAYNAERSLVDISLDRIQSRVDLYLALGGGFVSEEQPLEEY